jgi:uncharacterized protein YegP (UPF0339 family)
MQKIYMGKMYKVNGRTMYYAIYSDVDGYFVVKATAGNSSVFVGSTYKTYKGALNKLHMLESAIVADHLPTVR